MQTQTFGDERLRATVTVENDACWLVLADLHSGRTWPRVPVLALEVYDRGQLRVERLTQYQVEHLEPIDCGAHLLVRDRPRGIEVGLWLRIKGGELSVVLAPAEIYEFKSQLYRLFAVDLLPGMMRADSNGEMLLPINTGVICQPGDKGKCADRFLIYGEQHRWELLPTLPVCAVQNPGGGLTAIAVSAAGDTECRVATTGPAGGKRGSGTVGLSFFLRGHDVDPVEQERREIRFIPIPPGKDITVFTAAALRRHIMRDLGKPTLERRAKESPEVAHLLGAYIMKLFFGVQRQGCMLGDPNEATPSASRFLLTMTFDEASAALQSLHDAGVDSIYTQNVGWNYRGHDGAYPTRFPVEERVGGEAAFRRFIAHGHSLGYQMTVHDNYIDAYEISPDFDPEVVTHDRYGQMQVRGFWGGGPSYLLWPSAFGDRHLKNEMLRVKALGIRGPYYLDGMGSPLYVNHHPRHRGSRSEHARGIDRMLQTARKIFGSAATENGFLYCSLSADLVAHPGTDWHMKLCHADWPVTALMDRRVPLWNLTMCGLVVTENQGIDWVDSMQALLFGQHPRYEWATRPGHHPVLDKTLIRKIKWRHDLLIKRFGHLRLQQMTDYQREGSIETSTFEDGTCIVGDFASQELRVNGKRIERPDGAAAPALAAVS